VITGICLVLFSVAFIVVVIPLQVPEGAESTSLTPAFFPVLASAIILLLSLIYMVDEVRAYRRRTATAVHQAKEPPASIPIRGVGLALASMVLYTVAIGILGYLISSVAFLLFFVFFLGSKRWIVTVSIAVVASLLIYYLFAHVMLVPLPGWFDS
jgi:putative tricarboxylic transport membrane protein